MTSFLGINVYAMVSIVPWTVLEIMLDKLKNFAIYNFERLPQCILDMLICPQMWWGTFSHCLSSTVYYKSVSVKVTLFVHVTIDLLFPKLLTGICAR